MQTALLLTLFAGLTIPIGGLISSSQPLQHLCRRIELDHFMTAFGGGALLAAVALVLVPHGLEHSSATLAATAFIGGGLAFFLVDWGLSRVGGAASQFMAMLLDFIPEAIALGAMIATQPSTAVLLAIMMGLQNLPEGFGSYHELKASGVSSQRVWILLCGAPLIGLLAAAAGVHCFVMWPRVLSALMLFCSGGILYLIFQDIAPQARLKRHFFPPVGAVFGFLLGMMGTVALGG